MHSSYSICLRGRRPALIVLIVISLFVLAAIAASISEEAETIEEVYEPYLIQLGFLNRTPRGRVATELAYDYFNIKPKLYKRDQPALF